MIRCIAINLADRYSSKLNIHEKVNCAPDSDVIKLTLAMILVLGGLISGCIWGAIYNIFFRYMPDRSALAFILAITFALVTVFCFHFIFALRNICRIAKKSLEDPEIHEEYLRCVERATAVQEANAAIAQSRRAAESVSQNERDIRYWQEQVKFCAGSMGRNDPSSTVYLQAAAKLRVAEARLQEVLLKRHS
jgi:hypothetical protein